MTDDREVLLEAADILVERGRTRAVLATTSGCVCPLGAIFLARGHDFSDLVSKDTSLVYGALEYDGAAKLLAQYVTPVLPDRISGYTTTLAVFRWNDNNMDGEDTETVAEQMRLAARG